MSGRLSVRQAVRQSWIIHPDWDARTHLAWLHDEGYDTERLWGGTSARAATPTQTVEAWLYEDARQFVSWHTTVEAGRDCTSCGARWQDGVLEHNEFCTYTVVWQQMQRIVHETDEAIARGGACPACRADWVRPTDGAPGELTHDDGCTHLALLRLLDTGDV